MELAFIFGRFAPLLRRSSVRMRDVGLRVSGRSMLETGKSGRNFGAILVHIDKCRDLEEITCKVRELYFGNGMRGIGRILRDAVLTSDSVTAESVLPRLFGEISRGENARGFHGGHHARRGKTRRGGIPAR